MTVKDRGNVHGDLAKRLEAEQGESSIFAGGVLRPDQMRTLDDIPKVLGNLPGMLLRAEGMELAAAASQTPADTWIVEVGSFKGLSTCYIGLGSKLGRSNPVAAIDTWTRPYTLFGQVKSGRTTRAQLGDKNTLPGFVNAIRHAGLERIVKPHEGLSLDVADEWNPRQRVSMLFFDASKNPRFIRNDAVAWLPYCIPGAWVGWHDNDDARMREVLDHFVVGQPEYFADVHDVDRLTIARLAGDPTAAGRSFA